MAGIQQPTRRFAGSILVSYPVCRFRFALPLTALFSRTLSRLRRDPRCKGFAKAFPAHGEGGAKRRMRSPRSGNSPPSRSLREARCKGYTKAFPAHGEGGAKRRMRSPRSGNSPPSLSSRYGPPFCPGSAGKHAVRDTRKPSPRTGKVARSGG